MRILVDGDSLLRQWTGRVGDGPRHGAILRDELINRLTLYHDATGLSITLVFDGARAPGSVFDSLVARDVEIRYPKPGQPSQQLIERLAQRVQAPDEALVVTDNQVDPKRLNGHGVQLVSCDDFIQMTDDTLQDLEREITHLNQRERSDFLRHS